MKKYLIGALLLVVGCQPGAVKPPVTPEQPIIEPVVVEEPIVIESPDCSKYERSTGNPAIDEWLKKELSECLGLTN